MSVVTCVITRVPRSTLRPHNHEMDRSSNSTDEGISLSTISQRRMSASFERRLPTSLERRLSGGKPHLGEGKHELVSIEDRPITQSVRSPHS